MTDKEMFDWLEKYKEKIFCLSWDNVDSWSVVEQNENGCDLLGEGPSVREAIINASKNVDKNPYI